MGSFGKGSQAAKTGVNPLTRKDKAQESAKFLGFVSSKPTLTENGTMNTTLSGQKPSENPSLDARSIEIPPTSNTGGNSDKISATTSFIDPVHIDTFSLTGKLDTLPVPISVFTDDHRINWISAFLAEKFGIYLGGDTLAGVNFYKYRKGLYYSDGRPQKNLGYVAWGGASQKGSFQIYGTGELCEYLNMIGRMQFVGSMAEKLKMKVSRADVAHDDFEGSQSVDDAVGYYKQGGFTFTRDPSINQMGNWLGNDTKGRTVYIGSRDSGKLLRVYEKGKQLGDPASPWVRWEVELKAKDRVIPYDIFSDPAKYFTGCYPVLKKFIAGTAAQAIKTVKKKVKITVERALDVLKAQYGRYIGVLSGSMSPADFISRVSVDGVPRGLVFPVPKVSATADTPDPLDHCSIFDPLGVT